MERAEVYRSLSSEEEINDPQLFFYYYYFTAGDPDMFAVALKKIPLTSDMLSKIFSLHSLHPRSFQILMSIDLPEENGMSYLTSIASSRSDEEFEQALVAFGDNSSNGSNGSNGSILHQLTKRNVFGFDARKKIEICLRHGVDPLRCDGCMRTPLYYAHPSLVHLLLPYVHFDSLSPNAKRSAEESLEAGWQYLPSSFVEPDDDKTEQARTYLAHHGSIRSIAHPYKTLEEAAQNGNLLANVLLVPSLVSS